MNARDDDADREQGFLGRWIKRKAEVRDKAVVETDESDEAGSPVSGASKAEGAPGEAPASEPVFDLSTLPKLDEITAQTNITDFMRREVPAALRNAALRQAWAIDPAIRDYVNPAREYAYDWNIPGGVPGNGPIEAGFDALKQVAEAFSKPQGDHPFDLGEDTVVRSQEEVAALAEEPEPASPVRMSDAKMVAQNTVNENKNIIPDDVDEDRSTVSQETAPLRRRHGGAAPV